MKISELKGGASGTLLERLEADVAAKISALFARCPALCGFAIRDRAALEREVDRNRIPDADLFVTEIGIFPALDDANYGEIYEEITSAITELVHEQPHAYDYLRGRTFARTLH